MKRRLAAAALACAAIAAAGDLRAQQVSPRDLWPQTTSAAREGDFDTANKRSGDLLATGRTYGIKTYPEYAGSAAGLASQTEKSGPVIFSLPAARTASRPIRNTRPPRPAWPVRLKRAIPRSPSGL